MKKVKLLLQKPIFKKWIAPIVRGTVKQIPIIGAPVSELISNITQPEGAPPKHTNLSQYVQWAIAGLIIYDVLVNKATTIKEMLDYFGVLGLLK